MNQKPFNARLVSSKYRINGNFPWYILKTLFLSCAYHATTLNQWRESCLTYEVRRVTRSWINCNFPTGKIDCLGRVIRLLWQEIAAHTTDVVEGLKSPTDISEVCLFLELCNVCGSSVPIFARKQPCSRRSWKKTSRRILVLNQKMN